MGGGAKWTVGAALLLGAFAVAVGCAPPSVGELPSGNAHDTSDSSDDDDSTPEPTSKVSSAEKTKSADLPSTKDAGSDAAPATPPCTESGAVQFGGHCYFALATPVSWDDAKTACAGKSAHLATFTSSSEAALANAIDQGDERWIGLRRPDGSATGDSAFVWVTNEPRNGFANWDADKKEPDNGCPSCNNGAIPAECARVLTNGQWADDSCAATHPALCERD
jgi:hypothetical protein